VEKKEGKTEENGEKVGGKIRGVIASSDIGIRG